MTHGEWLKREVAAWKSDGLVDAATVDRILGRYAPSARRLSWGIMIIGGFGAFLIGLGIIALFAANWDCFGRAARAAISLSPVVLCGVIALVAKEWHGAFRPKCVKVADWRLAVRDHICESLFASLHFKKGGRSC